jgi:TolB-like protein/tetratricopeptide (TPR) repeat protein
MDVLVCLADHPNEAVSKEVLHKEVWHETFVTQDVLTRAISELRRTFQDDPRNPRFIETIPKRGYRLIAPVTRNGSALDFLRETPHLQLEKPSPISRLRWFGITAVLVSLIIVLGLSIPRANRFWRTYWAGDTPQIHSIAVLPLKTLGHDEQGNYLASGITDELIASLSQIRALAIISSTSSAVYANSSKPIAQIARELGVDAVVRGTILQSGAQVRVTAELMNASGKSVWTGSFESQLQDVVTQQRALTRKIAAAVQAELTPEESQRLARVTPVNPQAYSDYLLGEYCMWNRLSTEGRQDAVRYLERAVAEDPSYAPSHASLALAYFRMAPEVNDSRPNELFERSKAAAFKAAELDPLLPDAHRILGVIFAVTWDLPSGAREFARAVELEPSDARTLYLYAMYLSLRGQHDEAISTARRATTLDPLNVSVQSGVGKMYLFAGRYDNAIVEFSRLLEKDPSASDMHGWLGVAYEQKGDYPRALAELAKDSDPSERARTLSLMGYIFAKEGEREKASANLRELTRMSRDPASEVSPVDFAIIYAGLGDTEKSIDWLLRAYHQHDQSVLEVRSLPEFATLRPDHRFQDLVRRLGF